MINRMLGVMRLNVHTFEDVEHDTSAMGQALLVVVIVSIASAIGAFLSFDFSFKLLIFGLVGSVVRWALWAFVIYLVGTTILKTPETHADWGQVARTTGFAQSPGVFQIFVFLPFLGGLIALVVLIWQLVAMVIAVRQSLDYQSTWRAVGVVVIGFIIMIIPLAIIARILGLGNFS